MGAALMRLIQPPRWDDIAYALAACASLARALDTVRANL
jgi:hypothetical protein